MSDIYECKDKVKEILFKDNDKLVMVLESLGCHHINLNFGKNELRCALPDGNTPTSVSILKNEFISCNVFSRPDYDNYKVKDIIAFVQFLKECNFDAAVNYLCQKLGIEFDGTYIERRDIPILKIINNMEKRNNADVKTIVHDIIDEKYLTKFSKKYITEWEDEGIPRHIQDKYNLFVDEREMKYIIPIYDENGNLITVKGRTYIPNHDIMGIPKYIYYIPIGKGNNDILYGLNFNKQRVKEKNEIIIFEGGKSVMKADGYEYDWGSSVGKNGINPNLVNKILSLHCNVVIAFDKDVSRKIVIKEARKLTPFTNVDIIIDEWNLLDDKDSPVDKGKNIWEFLYNNKERVR